MSDIKTIIKRLKDQERVIRKRIEGLEDKEFRKEIPRFKKMVGDCFVYRGNKYSGSEEWDVYRKILDYGITKNNFYFIFEEFQVDCNGQISLLVDKANVSQYGDLDVIFCEGYTKVSNEIYENERTKMITEFNTQSKLKKSIKGGGEK